MSEFSHARATDPIEVEGVLELNDNKSGILLSPKKGLKKRPTDPFIPNELIKRFRLKRGSFITATAQVDPRHPNPRIRYIQTIDGAPVDAYRHRIDFSSLTTITPDEYLKLETTPQLMTTRVLDLFCPIGKGQRGLIVAPPRAGKTTLLKDIAKGILTNHPECHLIILLIDERPEEVTDFKRDMPTAEVLASSNDETITAHLQLAELAIERAKRLTEAGKDVVVLLDSITRLSRAYNAALTNSGRTMTGGLDVRALEKPRQIFSSARNTEDGGSLTIIGTALIETGSKMDDLIFQEFKGTGNMEMVLDRKAAELRLWPAINLSASGTRKEELLLSAATLEKIHFLRRAVAGLKIEDATEALLSRVAKTANNEEFLKLITV